MSFLLAFLLVLPVFVHAEPVQGRPVAARHPVNDLAAFIRRDSSVAAEDVSKRVVRWVLGNEGGDYLSQGLRGDAVQAALLEEAARSLTQRLLRDRTGDGAVLFFVLGAEGDAPHWIQSPDLAAALAQKKTQRLKIFLESMEPWRGKLGRGNAEQEVAAFLNEAVTRAFEVFSQPRVRKEFVAGFPDVSGPLLAPVSGLGGGGARLNDPTKGFSWESLYERGGVVMDITAGDVKRRISIKIYTKEENGQLVDKVGIFDLTTPNEAFGRRFGFGQSADLGKDGEKTFLLDTRNPLSPEYTLKMAATTDGDMAIVFGNKGLKGQVMKTSLKQLYRLRAEQAMAEGGEMKINEETFIVMGQGGAKGSLLFYPSDIEERLKRGENVKPLLAADVDERSSDGRNVNVKGEPSLGYVGDPPKYYKLVFNDKADPMYWEVTEGLPPPPPPDCSSCSRRSEEGYEPNTEVAKGLDRQWDSLVQVFDWKGAPREVAKRHRMTVPASVRKEPAVFVYFPVPAGYSGMSEVRGIGKYLAVTSDISTVYQDLSEPAALPGPGEMDKVFKYDASCVVDEVKKTLCVADLVLLQDAMTRAGFSGREIDKAQENAAQALKDSRKTKNDDYRVESGKAVNSLTLRVGEAQSVAIWPEYKPAAQGHGHSTSAR